MIYLLSCCLKVVETTGSSIERLLPKHIHAITARGFELSVGLFVLGASFKSFQIAIWLKVTDTHKFTG